MQEKEREQSMKKGWLHIIAVFCIYLIMNFSLVSAFSISHNPNTEVTAGERSAEIRWTTDDNADAEVEYGETASLGSSEENSTIGSSHSVRLEGLLPGTTYYYSLISTNQTGETITDDNSGNYYSFTTPADTTPPRINASLPAYHNAPWIGFTGVTDPDSIVRVYVNRPDSAVGTSNYDYIASSDATGIFVFPRVNLPQDSNEIVVWVRDSAGNTNQESHTVRIDTTPPNITLEVTSPDSEIQFSLSGLPSTAPSSSLNVKGTTTEPVNITIRVNNDTRTESADNEFELSLSLDSGRSNNVLLSFRDRGGNTVSFSNTITVDEQGPQIVDHNLPQLDPSYVQNIEVRGNASKPNVKVIVFVNNLTRSSDAWSTSLRDMVVHYGGLATGQYEEDYVTTTDENGRFKLDVFLTQDIVSDLTETGLTQEQGTGGQQPTEQPDQQTVTGGDTTGEAYGIPSVWDNVIRIVAVDDFGRSDEVEDVVSFAKCGVGGDWNINIREMTPSVVTPEHLRQGIAELNFWGTLEWQGPGEDEGGITGEGSRPRVENFAVRKYSLNEEVRKDFVIDPDELSGTPTGFLDQASRRTFYSTIPLNQIDYTQAEWEDLREGIDRDEVELMVPIEIEIEYSYQDNQGETVRRIQRQCVDARTIVDIQVPPDKVIPDWLLKDSIEFLQKTIDTIDDILEPLQEITLTIFITCLLSWVVYFVMMVQEKIFCGRDSSSSRCSSAKKKLEQTKLAMHWICDRVFCPSVPMINKYIRDTGYPGGDKGDSVVCDSSRANSLDYIEALEGNPTSQNFQQAVTTAINCEEGEGSSEQCCGQQYMNDWDSACVGIRNELTESKCLLAMESGHEGLSSLPSCENDVKNFMRSMSMSNLCSKAGGEDSNVNIVQYDRTAVCKDNSGNWYYCKVEEAGTETEAGIDRQHERSRPNPDCPGYLGTVNNRNVYVVSGGNRRAYTQEVMAIVEPGDRPLMLYKRSDSQCFSGGGDIGRKTISSCAIDQSSGIIYQLGSEVGAEGRVRGTPVYASCAGRGNQTPSSMQDDYHESQREYVVNPTKGLVNSVKCACLPAINGHLQLWRNILVQVKQCFETILLTGDGSPGVCRAVLAQYVCDLIYKAIRCFVQAYGVGESRDTDYSGPGGFAKAIAESGRGIQEDITGRYGDTGLYNTMFNERQLMTSVCLFAFTGDFDFDIGGMLSGVGTIPLETQAFVYPHTRRFMGSNPLKKGYATWTYHIGVGMSAGTDLNYHLYLVCSDTHDCNPSEGFMGGRCDCAGKGEQVHDITNQLGAGYLSAGEMIGPNDGDVYVKVREHPYRYDTVRLVWDPTEDVEGAEGGKIEEKTTIIGGRPPAECSFDLAAGEFRCGFTVGDIGHAGFIGAPELLKTTPYAVGDRIMADAKVEKRSPGFDSNSPEADTDKQIPFFLVYAIKDGSTILHEGYKRIVRDGTMTHTIPSGGFEVTEDAIMGAAVRGTYTVSDVSVQNLNKIRGSVVDLDSPTAVSDFYVRFKRGAVTLETNDEGKDIYEAHKDLVEVCDGNIEQTDKGRAFRNPDCHGLGDDDSAETKGTTGSKLIVEYKGVKMGNIDSETVKENENSGFVIDYAPPETELTELCEDKWDLSNPKEWTFAMGLYRCSRIDDSEPYSHSNCAREPSNQLVEYYGEGQYHELPVKVVCSETDKNPVCQYDVLVDKECVCVGSGSGEGETAEPGQFCHLDRTNNEVSVHDYKPCPLEQKVDENTDNNNRVRIGERYWCGCDDMGNVEDCTEKVCKRSDQGEFMCMQAS